MSTRSRSRPGPTNPLPAPKSRTGPPKGKSKSTSPSLSRSAVVVEGGLATQEYGPRYLRFLVKPTYSLAIILTTIISYLVYPLLISSQSPLAAVLPTTNPFAAFLLLSYPVTPPFSANSSAGGAGSSYAIDDVNATLPLGVGGGAAGGAGEGQYGKGLNDLLFLAFYVVVHSFVRHALMRGPLRQVAKWVGVRKGGKTARFVQESYSVVYFTASGLLGLKVMSQQKSWWFQTEHFWTDYPQATLSASLKAYYLLQFAYWLQETFVILARLEKPRADNTQMTFHHIVTIWLIAESYIANLEQIGLAVFVSSKPEYFFDAINLKADHFMTYRSVSPPSQPVNPRRGSTRSCKISLRDLPDFMLSFSKCINYAELENTGNCSFLVFIASWTYLRHYQNIRMLYSVWNQKWMETWFRMMIFVPIMLLQITMFFWSYRIGRVVYKLIKGTSASDDREKGETDTESEGEDERDDVSEKNSTNGSGLSVSGKHKEQ